MMQRNPKETPTMIPFHRRHLLATAGGLSLASLLPAARAQQREFNPQPGDWRAFEMTTTIELKNMQGPAKVWVPIPAIDSDYQRSHETTFSGNAGATRVVADSKYGAKMVYAEFADAANGAVSVTSRIETKSRATDWSRKAAAREDAETLRYWTQATELMPTDGIVQATAQEATRGAKTDIEKVQRLYDWVVSNTYREPKVRGCGTGDIKTMLETKNFGGKCGDINALFVGLARSVGVPARDVYGIRLVPSAFGYKELGGNPASLKSAQHCRAEVFLRDHGWVAMDPADVGKVMRLETAEWIKDPSHPVVAPVKKALFGGWEGNWLAYNVAHDVALPNSNGPWLGFFMYPQAESAAGRVDPLAPDDFKYTISARELKA
jgi:transglutaminase-like putative cysteine protease